jgi:hypothetical protein
MKRMSLLAPIAALGLALTTPTIAQAKGGVTFLIVGDTLANPFAFTNTSDAGERITGFGFDLSPIARPHSFDTMGVSSRQFGAAEGTAALTGLISSPIVPDNAQALTLAFGDFDVGETFKFFIDVDSAGNPTVRGHDLIGARVFFDFSDGSRAEGFLRAVDGQANASTFVTERFIPGGGGAVPEPATWAMMILGFGAAGAVLRRRPTLARA